MWKWRKAYDSYVCAYTLFKKLNHELTRILREAGRGALGPRRAEYKMSGDEPHLTVIAIYFNEGNFEGVPDD